MTTEHVQQSVARPVTFTTPSELEIHIERTFDAPRDRVWAVFTDPTLIPQWWGPGTSVDHMLVEPGGTWKFLATYPNGYEMAFHGTYQEVDPPERIVQTFETTAAPGRVHIETTTFEDLGDRTKMTVTLVFDTTEQRDSVVNSGAERGSNETYARLDELLARG